jgi:hypothetical protein
MAEVQAKPAATRGETVQRERYHLGEQMVNLLGHASQSARLPWTNLDRSHLVETARRRTRLEDAGDPRFLVGLDRLLRESHGRYTPLGNLLLRNLVVRALENRLRSLDYIRRHPDVLSIPIRSPIVVLGFPRSGTTLLQTLLAASPDWAPLEFWELSSIAPLQEVDPAADKAARIRQLGRILRMANLFVPELDRIHHSTPTTPEEDWQLLVPSFHALTFELAYGLEEYGRWLQEEADMVWAYGELKQRLQIILHQHPRQQLVLKCPDHLWFIDALLQVFPDACIVQPHRDPVRCITSYTSMISLQERTLTGRIAWKALAERLTRMFLRGARQAHAARLRHDARQFFDVPFERLVADPAGMVRQIFRHFGMGAPCESSVKTELRRPRADRPGSHRYSYDRLGIDPEAIRAKFRWYTEAYAERPGAAA